MLSRCASACAIALAAAFSAHAELDVESFARSLPERANGVFTERKTLCDVDVTLVSSGRWSFVKDVCFELETLKPVKSAFKATMDGYSTTVRGVTTETKFGDVAMSEPLAALCRGDLSAAEKLFRIDEIKGGFRLKPIDGDMASIVKRVEVLGGGEDAFTSRVQTVRFLYANGDTIEIVLSAAK